jgi:lysozyme family protein
MARDTFPRALKCVLVHEGGKVDHPKDPGGRTNQGVIQRVYDGYRRRKGLSPRDVFLMTAKERDEIYRTQYWNVVKGDQLPAGIDYVVFDGAVNSGPVQSVKWLQRALGQRVDGLLGEATLSACERHPNHSALIADICARRMTFLRALKTWPTFGKGWSARVSGVKRTGLEMAMGAKQVLPEPALAEASEKALIEDAQQPPQTASADMAAAGGAPIGGTAAEMVDRTKDALAPATGTSKWLDLIYTGLVLAGVLVTVAGILWALKARKDRRELNDALDSATPDSLGYSS